jgi:hypothetical protein
MSTAPPATPGEPPPSPTTADEKNEITIVSHSNLFYWWPVWAVGLILGLLTWLYDRHLMAVVPHNSNRVAGATVTYHEEGGKKVTVDDRVVIIYPELPKEKLPLEEAGAGQPPQAIPLKVHVASKASYGVFFATVLLLVIVITNVPLRGMWSVMVITLIVLLTIIFALAGWWEDILRVLGRLDIRINAAGYLVISLVLLGIWLVTVLFFDRNIYIVFSPGQMRVCTEIGGGEKVYDTMGLSLEKQRSDLFRHWILGLGSGDLVVKTSGAQAHHFDLANVLFIGRKVRMIENMLRERKVIPR